MQYSVHPRYCISPNSSVNSSPHHEPFSFSTTWSNSVSYVPYMNLTQLPTWSNSVIYDPLLLSMTRESHNFALPPLTFSILWRSIYWTVYVRQPPVGVSVGPLSPATTPLRSTCSRGSWSGGRSAQQSGGPSQSCYHDGEPPPLVSRSQEWSIG